MTDGGQRFQMRVGEARRGETSGEGFVPIALQTTRGEVSLRFYPAAGAARGAVVYVGGVGGGWDTPALGLYPRLCQELAGEGIAGLRVQFRHPGVLEESALDVLAGLHFLAGEMEGPVGLVGHSFGGAVMIQAAAVEPRARIVVTLATQGHGAAPVSRLGPRCATVLIHGTADTILPAASSEHVFQHAREPKRLVLLEGASHVLDTVAEEVYREVRYWLVQRLAGGAGQGGAAPEV